MRVVYAFLSTLGTLFRSRLSLQAEIFALRHQLAVYERSVRRSLLRPADLLKLDRFDLLILDDFSYVRRDQAESSVLFELISERYERKSIAVTANQPFSAWDQVFPEPAMTLAAVDRLVHHATILEMNVESYRRKAARPAQTAQATTKSKSGQNS